jgi:hypothetical protein
MWIIWSRESAPERWPATHQNTAKPAGRAAASHPHFFNWWSHL